MRGVENLDNGAVNLFRTFESGPVNRTGMFATTHFAALPGFDCGSSFSGSKKDRRGPKRSTPRDHTQKTPAETPLSGGQRVLFELHCKNTCINRQVPRGFLQGGPPPGTNRKSFRTHTLSHGSLFPRFVTSRELIISHVSTSAISSHHFT